MKVGDYVRLKNGYIDKIEELKLQTKYTKYNKLLFEHKAVECLFSDEDLKQLKSSPNIMDLIEVGDFITYKKGNMYIDIPYRVYGTYNEILEETELRIDDEYLKDIEILSIVTHEQFERMQYNLESEVN